MSVQQNLFQVKVYDYLMTADNKPIVGKQVSLQASVDAIAISQSGTSVMIPMTNVFSTKTDQFGYWSILINPTDKFSVNGVLYTVMDGIHEEYQIDAPFAGVPGAGWQSSARIQNAPAVLTPTGQTLTGPLIAPSITDSGLTTGQVVFPGAGGLLSGSAGLFWDNVGWSLRIGNGVTGQGLILNIADAVQSLQWQTTGVGKWSTYLSTGYLNFFDVVGGANRITLGPTGVGNILTFRGIGGADYLQWVGAAAQSKFWQIDAAGFLKIANNAFSVYIFNLSDTGNVSISGGMTTAQALVVNAGAADISGGVLIRSGALSFLAAASIVIPGTLGLFVDNNANTFTNFEVDDNGLVIVNRNSLRVGGDIGAGVAGFLGLTNTVGIGNGANTNMQAPLKATGGGPTSAVLVTDWIKIWDGTVARWIPAFT